MRHAKDIWLKYAIPGWINSINLLLHDESAIGIFFSVYAHNKITNVMAKYSKAAQKSVERAMHEMKEGDLRSGRSGKKVTNPKQAIAIGLSEAREKGAKVPQKKAGRSPRKGGTHANRNKKSKARK